MGKGKHLGGKRNGFPKNLPQGSLKKSPKWAGKVKNWGWKITTGKLFRWKKPKVLVGPHLKVRMLFKCKVKGPMFKTKIDTR